MKKTSQDKARQVKTSKDKSRQGKTSQDKARQVKTGQDKSIQGKTSQDKARQVKTSQDKSRLGMQCGVGYAVRGKKNRKEKDLITYVARVDSLPRHGSAGALPHYRLVVLNKSCLCTLL